MSNFAALCHFCENHGPCVIMMTQAVRDNRLDLTARSDDVNKPYCLYECDVDPKDGGWDMPSIYPATENSSNNLHGKLSLLRSQSGPGNGRPGCDGCWSLYSSRGAIYSTDSKRKMSYVSTQSGIGYPGLKAREAAIKTISCEVLTEKTGSLILSENPFATVFAQTFFLKDYKARGFQRYYSIIVGSRERSHLISSWNPVKQAVSEIVHILIKKAMENFNLESKLSDMGKTPDRSVRRVESSRPRNLSQLARDHTVFLLIHKHFARIIHQVENLKVDDVVVGQPMRSSTILNEYNISTFTAVCQQLEVAELRLLIHCVLTGTPLEIQCCPPGINSAGSCGSRQLARRLANGLSLLLPNNPARDRAQFANVVLSAADFSKVAPGESPKSSSPPMMFDHKLVIFPRRSPTADYRHQGVGKDKARTGNHDGPVDTEVLVSESSSPFGGAQRDDSGRGLCRPGIEHRTRTRDYPEYQDDCLSDPDFQVTFKCRSCRCGTTPSAPPCKLCRDALSSRPVASMVKIGRSQELPSQARHMRLVTTVESVLVQAKVWRRLRGSADKREFIKRMDLGRGDAPVLDFFQMFVV